MYKSTASEEDIMIKSWWKIVTQKMHRVVPHI